MIFKGHLKYKPQGPEEVAQGTRALADLAEELNLISSSHIWGSWIPITSASGIKGPFLASTTNCMHVVYFHTHTNKNKINILVLFLNISHSIGFTLTTLYITLLDRTERQSCLYNLSEPLWNLSGHGSTSLKFCMPATLTSLGWWQGLTLFWSLSSG